MKKIGILGSGAVAQNLGAGFSQLGYTVMIGTAHPENVANYLATHPDQQSGSFAQAAAYGDLLVLAVKGQYADQVLAGIPPASIAGKLVIDTTNPIDNQPPVNNVLHYFTGEQSLLEMLQTKYKNAHFVKAFNSIGASLMVQPDFAEKPTMFICGDNDLAKDQVTGIVEQFGFEVADLGQKEAGKTIESLCILWCIEGFRTGVWDKHALRLIRKN